MLRFLCPRWDPPAALRPDQGPAGVPDPGALSIRWLGTAGHALTLGKETLLLDPFVSRTPARRLWRRLRSDPAAIERWAPEARAVVVGHAHYDHLLDAPEIARRTGALFVGSASAARVARAQGVPEGRIREATGRLTLEEGPFAIRLVPSLHAKLVLGLAPPFPGEIGPVSPSGSFVHQYRAGQPFGVVVTAGGVSVYHNGSADLVDAELDGLHADVLLVGIAGRQWTEGYLERLVRKLEPRVIVPTHHDAFFWPLEEGVRLLPGIRIDAFLEEARRLAPSAVVVSPTPFEALRVDQGGQRLAVVRA